MLLGDYYRHDPRVTLLPIEHLQPSGITVELAEFLRERCGWPQGRIELFDQGFSLYWSRSTDLAARTRSWPAPRLRHVAVVEDALAVRPYAQMLNTSAWTIYASDLDAATSSAELLAYLLVHWDRMTVSGEITLAAVHTAAYWFERTETECVDFTAGAERSSRPDAEGFRAVARALPWLRQLRHEALRPPVRLTLPGGASTYRAIASTGLFVPLSLEKEPPALAETWRRVASSTVAAFSSRWKTADPAALHGLLRWLEDEAPPVLVTGRNEAILWDPVTAGRLGTLRQELRGASGAGLRDITADLRVIAAHTRSFLGSLDRPEDLPEPKGQPEQQGYAYLHRERRIVAYNLHEPWIERLHAPALPYARAMLGARTVHEWCHLAVDAGFVPQTATAERLEELLATAGALLDAVARDAPAALRRLVEGDLRPLGPLPGRELARGMLERVADYRANLLAQRYLSEAERETYVRQNVRTLRGQFRPPQAIRALVRYLYEYQYLRFSRVPDPRTFFLRSTWFEEDFLRSGIVDDARFDALVAAVGALCDAYAVNDARLRPQIAE